MGTVQVKITLPDEAVGLMDELRGDVPRSLWILRRLEAGGGFGVKNFAHAMKTPALDVERSPEPREDLGSSRERPVQPRPIIQKRK